MRGAFHCFTHRHEFREVPGGTLMVDDFYASPLGVLGILADKLFLERYMWTFLQERAQALTELAETLPAIEK